VEDLVLLLSASCPLFGLPLIPFLSFFYIFDSPFSFLSSSIFDAAKDGDLEQVFAKAAKLTSSQFGTTIDHLRDDESYTLAMRAIQGSHYDLVKSLVTRMNASLGQEVRNQYSFTCLHLAAFHEVSSELLTYILSLAADSINTAESGGWTPLVIAASKGNLRIVKLLLDAGADVNAKTYMDQTALYVSSNNGFSNVVNILLDHGADAKIRMKTSFESPAFASITSGHLHILKRLLDHEPELLRLPTVSGATILHAAAQIGKEANLELLLKYDIEVDAKKKDGTTPLACAAALGHAHVVRLLLEKGASLDCRNGFGGTPLHLACNSKQLSMVQLLLEHHADPNAFDSDRISPLQSLCSSACITSPSDDVEIQIFDLLLQYGANVNHKDRSNATFMHQLVCKRDNLTLLKHVLLKYPQFDLFQEDKYGYLALHVVHRYRHTEIIETLSRAMAIADPSQFALFDANKTRIEPPIGVCDIFETIPIEDRQSVLELDLSVQAIAKRILSGKVKNVIILTGAGISTNSGIPDFRSPEKGLYTSPQFRARFGPGGVSGLFSPEAVVRQPEEFFSVVKEIFGPAVDGRYKPTPAHFFIKLLHEKGLLRRNYTQNIDMLERLVGIPKEKVIEAHGSFAKASCVKCHAPCNDMEGYWKEIRGDEVPRCNACRGVLRPNVVFFGEGLPAEFTDFQAPDFAVCDLIIVMGTSLKVYPFAGLANQVNNLTPRLLINAEPVGAFVHGAQWKLNEDSDSSSSSSSSSSSPSSLPPSSEEEKKRPSMERIQHKNEYVNSYRDVAVLGDIDKAVLELTKALGWEEELSEIIRSYQPTTHFQ
jgi:NAD-dependent deacetylase sirtuin 2